MQETSDDFRATIYKNVADALAEDIGKGDLTANLVGAGVIAGASIIARESLTLAGHPWVDEVFRQLDPDIVIDWYVADGQQADAGDVICKLIGSARALLSGERTALNFLQTLSATATTTAAYVGEVQETGTRILDTRKTLPGLRHAQKYAVLQGGGVNHRFGLFDAILIKENHIRSSGGIANAIVAARNAAADVLIEVEVENLDELQQALDAGCKRILLDNFSNEQLRQAVMLNAELNSDRAELEASGNITLQTIRKVAETGVDYISIGALTKNVAAIDLSMLFRID